MEKIASIIGSLSNNHCNNHFNKFEGKPIGMCIEKIEETPMWLLMLHTNSKILLKSFVIQIVWNKYKRFLFLLDSTRRTYA
jgi:hypothetical protein